MKTIIFGETYKKCYDRADQLGLPYSDYIVCPNSMDIDESEVLIKEYYKDVMNGTVKLDGISKEGYEKLYNYIVIRK